MFLRWYSHSFANKTTYRIWATICSHFEKSCQKKRSRQPRKVLWVVLSSLFFKKFERMAREAMDICLWVLKESNKSRFDSYSVRNSVLIISHITFRDCRVHIFPTTFLEIAVYGLNQTDFKKVYRSCVSVLFWKKPQFLQFWQETFTAAIHTNFPARCHFSRNSGLLASGIW